MGHARCEQGVAAATRAIRHGWPDDPVACRCFTLVLSFAPLPHPEKTCVGEAGLEFSAVGRDNQHADVRLCGAGDHVRNEVAVACRDVRGRPAEEHREDGSDGEPISGWTGTWGGMRTAMERWLCHHATCKRHQQADRSHTRVHTHRNQRPRKRTATAIDRSSEERDTTKHQNTKSNNETESQIKT